MSVGRGAAEGDNSNFSILTVDVCLISQPRKMGLVTDRPVTVRATVVLMLCSLILFYFTIYLVALQFIILRFVLYL